LYDLVWNSLCFS